MEIQIEELVNNIYLCYSIKYDSKYDYNIKNQYMKC